MTARRLASPLVVAFAALLALAGLTACGAAGNPSTAAVVGDRVITTEQVATTAHQINSTKDLQAATGTVSEQTVLYWLVVSGFVEQRVAQTGSWKPDDQYNSLVAMVTAPTPETLEFLRTNSAVSSMSADDKQAVVAAMQQATIAMNPRYGQINLQNGGLVPLSEPWIKAPPAPTA